MSKLHKKEEPLIKRVAYTKEELEKCKSELIDFSEANRLQWLQSKGAIKITKNKSPISGNEVTSISVIMLPDGSIPYTDLTLLWDQTLYHYSKGTFPTAQVVEKAAVPQETGTLNF